MDNSQKMRELAGAVESILFVAGDAVSLIELARALEIDEGEAGQLLDYMQQLYQDPARGIGLKRFGHQVQLATRAENAGYVERLLQPVQRQSLSQAALETLAVIAYRQPATRLDIEQVRGVKCDYSVQSLLNKGLIMETGRKDTLGRPILYGTTERFLAHFGLRSLDELPPMEQLLAPRAGDVVQEEMDWQTPEAQTAQAKTEEAKEAGTKAEDASQAQAEEQAQ